MHIWSQYYNLAWRIAFEFNPPCMQDYTDMQSIQSVNLSKLPLKVILGIRYPVIINNVKVYRV